MIEYETLGHMHEVPTVNVDKPQVVYLPHHPVFRENSTTTKLRVVFNASSKTSNGLSINDHQMIGPKLQVELPFVLLQWRTYKVVFSADIAQMYRQILIDPRDRDYQRILWRLSPSQSIKEYQLATVTYGTRSAPFLALRVIKQLVKDEGSKFPLATPILENDTYIDDIMGGAHDENSAKQTRNEIINLLQKGNLVPRKWASNSVEFLSDIDPKNH